MGILDNFKNSLKSTETDDWFDTHVVRPLGYLWALVFAKLGWTPNAVTIFSMFVGASASIFFYHGSFYYEGVDGIVYNVIAILLLFFAAVLDCTDGQLARLTGQSSPIGRILDGLAGYAWFLPIYIAITMRVRDHHSIEFGWLGIEDTPDNVLYMFIASIAIALISGFGGLGSQSRVVDYYIQIHLFFAKGRSGSELDDSKKQQEKYDAMKWEDGWFVKIFQKNYVTYTKLQEKGTPQFQRLKNCIRSKYGTDAMPQELCEELHQESRKVMKWALLIPFNFRMLFFIIFCLIDLPILYFLFEIIVMEFITRHTIHLHESFCRRIADKIAAI